MAIQGIPQQENENVIEVVKKITATVSLPVNDTDILSYSGVILDEQE